MTKFLSAEVQPLTDSRVVDTDVHITYNADVRRQIARYMDKPYSNYVDPDTSSDGYQSNGWPKSLGGTREFNLMDVTAPEHVSEPLFEGFGVDQALVNVLSPIDDLLKTEQARAEMRGINDWFIDSFLDEHDDLYGLITLTGRDPEAAAEEVDRLAGEKKLVGAFMAVGREFDKPVGDPNFDILYRALEDHDLPPIFHITGLHRKAQALRDLEKVAAWHATGPAWAGQLALTSLIMQGVPEKFPDLDFVLQEGGIGWLPGWLGRLNREYAQWRNELPLLTQSPEEYIRDSFYFTTQPMPEFDDPAHMKQLLNVIGADSLMFSTDHPHYDFDHPDTVSKILTHLDNNDRRQVLAGNALDVFDIK